MAECSHLRRSTRRAGLAKKGVPPISPALVSSSNTRLVYITTSVSSRPFRDVLGGSEDCSGGALQRFQVGKIALLTSELFDLRERLEILGTSFCSSASTLLLQNVGDVVGLGALSLKGLEMPWEALEPTGLLHSEPQVVLLVPGLECIPRSRGV